MPSYQYRDSHVKDKTVSPTVLSLTWESPYLGKTVFISRLGPDVIAYLHAVSPDCWSCRKDPDVTCAHSPVSVSAGSSPDELCCILAWFHCSFLLDAVWKLSKIFHSSNIVYVLNDKGSILGLVSQQPFTHWWQKKVAKMLQTIFLIVYHWEKIYVFWFKFH